MSEFPLQFLLQGRESQNLHQIKHSIDKRMKILMYYSEYRIDLDEKDSQYWANMAFSLQRDGKPKQAQKYYEKAIEIEPENISYLINLGSVLNAQGKHNEAVKYLRYVTKVAPDYVEGWINLSVAYYCWW